MKPRSKVLVLTILMLTLLMIGVGPIAAQAGIPISVGQNQQAELSATNSVAEFSLYIAAPQNVNVQVFALTQGLQPRLTVIGPSGIALQTIDSQGSGNAQGNINFASNGNYTLLVETTSGVFGTLVISLNAGAPLQAAVPITLALPINAGVDPLTPLHSYTFAALPTAPLVVSMQVPPGSVGGPLVTLQNTTNGQDIALASAQLTGMTWTLPAGTQTYTIIVSHSGAAAPQNFTLCVGEATGTNVCPVTSTVAQAALPAVPTTVAQAALPAVPTTVAAAPARAPFRPPQIPANGPCLTASGSGANINVRSGPTTSATISSRLPVNNTAPVVGRLADSSWYQVNISGVIGWVSGSVVVIGGNCGVVPVVAANSVAIVPTVAPGQPTVAPVVPTAVPVVPTAVPVVPPPPPPPPPAPSARLDYTLPPTYGSTSLTAGFLPDPYTISLVSGGSVDVSYLSGCTGFAASAPDFSVTYTSGTATLLRFFFVGDGDTTMIINAPSGRFTCIDDTFGTLHPTLDFDNPQTGVYDIWIGSYASGAFVNGTLSVTERTDLHP